MGKKKNPYVATLSGAVAGAVEATATWPTEFVKTQLQLQRNSKKNTNTYIYKNSWDCAKYTVQNNGFLGLYRGLTPVLLGSIPKAGVRFGGFTFFSGLLRDSDGKLNAGRTFCAGLAAGASEAVLIVTPMETLKVRLIDANVGLVEGTRNIIRTEGWAGVYKGVWATTLKQASNQGIRFLSYSQILSWLKGGEQRGSRSWEIVFGGMAAGCLSVLGNNPVDVVKTRMQGSEAHKYSSSTDCFRKTLKSDGPMGFYKGAIPRMARVVPGQGITFLCFESIQSFVEKLIVSNGSSP